MGHWMIDDVDHSVEAIRMKLPPAVIDVMIKSTPEYKCMEKQAHQQQLFGTYYNQSVGFGMMMNNDIQSRRMLSILVMLLQLPFLLSEGMIDHGMWIMWFMYLTKGILQPWMIYNTRLSAPSHFSTAHSMINMS